MMSISSSRKTPEGRYPTFALCDALLDDCTPVRQVRSIIGSGGAIYGTVLSVKTNCSCRCSEEYESEDSDGYPQLSSFWIGLKTTQRGFEVNKPVITLGAADIKHRTLYQ